MKIDPFQFCQPAKIYLAIAALGSLIAIMSRVPAMPVISKLAFAFLWSLFLNYLCGKGYTSVSWFLVLLPYVLLLLGILGFMTMAANSKKRK